MRGTVYFCVGMPEVRIVLTASRPMDLERSGPSKKEKQNKQHVYFTSHPLLFSPYPVKAFRVQFLPDNTNQPRRHM
jgi:hypothetical protein